MLTSYHNHTDWSDGPCTLEDQIEGARKAGLDELGISDHYIIHPSGQHINWSMPVARLSEYVSAVQCAMDSTTSPRIRLGIEADYFPETIEQVRATLAGQPFDYVIGSVHYVDGFCVDESAELWAAESEERRNAVWRLYWRRMREMAESRVFDIAAHFDLPKIYGFLPTIDLMAEALGVLDAMAAAGMAIEINTRGWVRPCDEAYPSPALLAGARSRGIPLCINADAHRPDQLINHFDRARLLAREAGYTELVRFEKRTMHPLPL